MTDLEEAEQGTNPNDADDFQDTDEDGVPDTIETAQGTNPDDADDFQDTDEDGLPDAVESRSGTNPVKADTDGDGIPDAVELDEGSDPTSSISIKDSDRDGVPDYVETQEGTNPLVATSFRDSDGNGVSDYAQARGAKPDRCQPQLESRHTATATSNAISQLYTAYFHRAPDDAGFLYWTALAEAGMSHEEISGYFAESSEFVETYGDRADDRFTTLVYNNVLCRNPDSAGGQYWIRLLAEGTISRSDLVLYFSQSIEFRTIGTK